jgi:XapX domain-containing protein
MNTQIVVLSLLTGLVTGGVFAFLEVPIPAPPELPGVVGIVGIYVGFKLVRAMGWSVAPLLSNLGF